MEERVVGEGRATEVGGSGAGAQAQAERAEELGQEARGEPYAPGIYVGSRAQSAEIDGELVGSEMGQAPLVGSDRCSDTDESAGSTI